MSDELLELVLILRAAKINAVRRAMTLTKGNRTHAAKLLKIHRNTLERMMDELELKHEWPTNRGGNHRHCVCCISNDRLH